MNLIKTLTFASILLTAISCGGEKKEGSEEGKSGNHDPKMLEFASIDCERITKANQSKQDPSNESLAQEVQKINEEMLQKVDELKAELGDEAFNKLLTDARAYNKNNCQ